MSKKIVARLQNGNFAVIFNQDNPGFSSIENCYTLPQINDENSFSFNPDKKVNDGEWLYLTLNPEQKAELIQPYLDTIVSSEVTNPITGEDYPDIRAICLIDFNLDIDVEKLFLTRVFPKNYTLCQKLLKWNDGPALDTQSSTVDFNGKVDAYWDGEKLFFRSYETVKFVFPGIESFYRSATEVEKNQFLQSDLFDCEPNIEVKDRNLKKIAAVIDSSGIDLSNGTNQEKYIAYANAYPGVGIEITEAGKFKIKSNKDVTNILNILEERLYTTPITCERREAHAVTKLDR